jgi:hypothetical protein
MSGLTKAMVLAIFSQKPSKTENIFDFQSFGRGQSVYPTILV